MDGERMLKLLNKLPERMSEPVRAGLAEEIKGHIPAHLGHHRRGIHTISIVVDLRVGKLTAAAIVIIAMVLLAAVLGGGSAQNGLLEDSKLLARFLFKGQQVNPIEAGKFLRDHLADKGKEVVFYGTNIDPKDSNSIMMHWKVSEDRYKVVFSDLREKEVSAEELVRLQARMLQRGNN